MIEYDFNRMKKFSEQVKRWARFNMRYLGKPHWDSGISPPELLDYLREVQPGRALDLGCGTGTNLLTLAQAGWQADGVEYALIAVRKARRKLAGFRDAVRVYLGSVAEVDYLSGPYDLILDIGCYHSLSTAERAQYRAHVLRFLAPGGTFLLYGFLRTESGHARMSEDEINLFAEELTLISRQEGQDHGNRPSIWLRFARMD